MGQIQQITTAFDSVEEFSVAVGPMGWYADFHQLERGPEAVPLRAMQGPQSVLLQLGLASRVHQQALPPAESVSLALLTGPQAPVRFGPREMDSETIACFDPAVGLDCVSDGGFSVYALSFSARRIGEIARSLGLHDPSARLGQHCRVDALTISRIRRLLSTLFDEIEHGDPQNQGNALSAIESELPEVLLMACDGGESDAPVSPTNRSRALQRAQEYIQSHPREAISVEDLCKHSACSVSTLERAFRDHFGASPKQYLTARRLSGVRRALVNMHETRNVGDVASEWGFWHMSKFAADYRRMFGELPSQTRYAARA